MHFIQPRSLFRAIFTQIILKITCFKIYFNCSCKILNFKNTDLLKHQRGSASCKSLAFHPPFAPQRRKPERKRQMQRNISFWTTPYECWLGKKKNYFKVTIGFHVRRVSTPRPDWVKSTSFAPFYAKWQRTSERKKRWPRV